MSFYDKISVTMNVCIHPNKHDFISSWIRMNIYLYIVKQLLLKEIGDLVR